jgi:uncharacterized protein (TIGR03066 family)
MLRTTLGCVLGLLLCGPLGADDKIDAKKLVGRWELEEKQEGLSVVIELKEGGKMTATVRTEGGVIKLEGAYRVDGGRLHTTLNADGSGRSEPHTIVNLTDAELVTKDKSGKEERMVRVKGK